MPEFVESVQELLPSTVRSRLRRAALSVLSGLSERVPDGPQVQIFNLHHVFPDEVEAFRAFVEKIQERYRVVPYSEAVRAVQRGPVTERIVAFSFDDGLASCWNAAEVLKSLNCTGMFFLCPSMQEHASEALQAEFCERRLLMKPMRFLSWWQIERMRADGHEFGNHTWSHPRISTLEQDAAEEEIEKGRETIERRLGECPHFAWPFGQFGDITPEAAVATFRLGHHSCASATRGAHVKPEGERGCVRRDHVVAGWPFAHVAYFIRKNVAVASVRSHSWPEGWGDRLG